MEEVLKKRSQTIDEMESYKIDLESKLDSILNVRQKFHLKYQELELDALEDHAYLDLCTIINEMATSFTAPAYHYNSYIDNLIKDLTWDDMKYTLEESKWESNLLRRVKYQADVQSVFLSIKTCLDRLIAIFTYYFRGISPSTTFGRYKDSGKATGLMSKVRELKESDNLMGYIEESYHKWIKLAVSPRDTIAHYNDLQINYHFDTETGFEIPTHGNGKILDSSFTSKTFAFTSLKSFIDDWYVFFEKVIQGLINRELISERARI